MTGATSRARLGILVKTYPKLSETFILEELLGLERTGLSFTLFSLQPPTDDIAHAKVAQVKARVHYAIERSVLGWARAIVAHARVLAAYPTGYVRTLFDALRARNGAGAREFVWAGCLVPKLRAANVTHLHVHFASEPASVAELVQRMSGISFSLSAHAKDIYVSRPADLARKLGAARFTVTCTQCNREHLAALAPAHANVQRMYHGIDTERFKPDRVAAASEPDAAAPPLILSVGRLREKKGHATLIEACRLLRNLGLVFRCEIVGYGEDHERLQRLIDENRLQSLVTLSGKQSQEYVIGRYRAASVFALPCQIASDGDRDGIPNVLLEAMAMQLPVVSTSVSGVPEVVEHGRNGLLVPPRDATALARALRTLIEDPALCARLGAAGRETVVSAFSNERNLQVVTDELRKALNDERGRVQTEARRGLAANTSEPEIAYILKGFPRLSETFIANEIRLLETMGMRLRLYVVKPRDEAKAHPVVSQIKAPIRYLPEVTSLSGRSLWRWLTENLPQFWSAHRALLGLRPWAYVGALSSAIAMSLRYRASLFAMPRKVFIKEFVQAGDIAAQILATRSVRHIHGHFCHGATTIAWFVSRLAGVPFSFTAHAKDIYQTEQNPGDLLNRKLNAACFATTCTAANHRHLSCVAPGAGDVHTVYHGLDTDYFTPPDERLPSDTPLVLAVGRFVEKKGLGYLVEACAELARRGTRVRCLLVGEPGDDSARIEQLIARHGLQEIVQIHGAVTQDQLRDIYPRASVFVLPCLVTADGDRDGIPNVLAEAMAMGLPVISTAISGIPELVDDGIDGVLVAERDSQALADAMQRVLGDAALSKRLGAAARAKIINRFDSKRTTLKLKGLFVNAMQGEIAVDELVARHS